MYAQPGIIDVLEKIVVTFSALFGSLYHMAHVPPDAGREIDAAIAALPRTQIELNIAPAGDISLEQSAADMEIIVSRFEQIWVSADATVQSGNVWRLSLDGPVLEDSVMHRILGAGRLMIGPVAPGDQWHEAVPAEVCEAHGVAWQRLTRVAMVPAADEDAQNADDGRRLVKMVDNGVEDRFAAFSHAFVAADAASLEAIVPYLPTEGLAPFIYCKENDDGSGFCLLQMMDTHMVLQNDHIANVALQVREYDRLGCEMTLSNSAVSIFSELTRRGVGAELPIVLDGTALMMPMVQAPITDDHLWITGGLPVTAIRAERLMLTRLFAMMVSNATLHSSWQPVADTEHVN